MKVSILGQGYVGLNVAIAAAKVGHQVIGIDLNDSLVSELRLGKTHVPGIESKTILELINSNNYVPTINPISISESEIAIITVPTPLNVDRDPDLSYLELASATIGKYAQSGLLVVNESTSYPGTLRNFIKTKIEKINSNELLFAAAPERVDPGNEKWNLENTPRVLAGLTPEATLRVKEFYSSFCRIIHVASTTEVAEASKLLENTFRQVNIALVNEFSEIANSLGFSANEAISAASTKPFGFMPFYPSIGVGGHCIPIDPSYLSYAAEISGASANIINLANKTNLLASNKIAQRIKEYMGGTLTGLKIQIAGVAYKTNVSDIRESPALLLMSEIQRLGAVVSWCDDLVGKIGDISSTPIDGSIDLGLIVTPHSEVDFSVWKNSGTKVLDLSANSHDFGWPKFL